MGTTGNVSMNWLLSGWSGKGYIWVGWCILVEADSGRLGIIFNLLCPWERGILSMSLFK